jgi:DNA-binding IclR family transcriptional regulator
MSIPSGPAIRSTASEPATRPQLGSQTLDRGLEVLQVVVDADRPMSLSEISAATSLNRSVTYRLLRTLEDRGLVTQTGGQGFQAGLGLLRLTPRIGQTLLEHARPVLTRLARQTGASAVLSIADRDHEVCLACVLPPTDGPFISIREGDAGALVRGASAIALLALRPEVPGERPEVTAARDAGPGALVRTVGELHPGAAGLAIATPDTPDRAIAVVFFDGSIDEERARQHLTEAARVLS